MARVADDLERMRAAVDDAQRDPAAVAGDAATILAGIAAHDDAELEATAAWAAGLAAREMDDLSQADELLERGVAVAIDGGLVTLAGRIRVSRSLVLAYRGDAAAAVAELDLADTVLVGVDLARSRMQRGLLHQRAGRLDEAFEAYGAALPGLVEAGDRVAEVRLRVNRSVGAIYRNDFDDARADLERARVLAIELGQSLQAASCAHNLAFLHGRRGDVPTALGWFDVGRGEYEEVDAGAAVAVLLIDRAEVLGGAGLTVEALADATAARDRIAGTDNRVELAEADLLVGRVALDAGDLELAHRAATDARTAFRGQRRDAWSVLAAAIAFRSRPDLAEAIDRLGLLVREDVPGAARLAGEARRLAARLAAQEWQWEARNLSTLAGHLWLAAGRPEEALVDLAPVAEDRRRGSVLWRVQGWRARALACAASGDRAGARRALRLGLRTIEDHRTTVAASDLRAAVSVIGDDLGAWSIELALDGGDPRTVLRAAEAWRGNSLQASVEPPEDPELERLLAELRGAASRPGDDRRRAELESAVRDRARRHAATVVRGVRSDVADLDGLGSALGSTVLIEYVQHSGHLHAVVVADGRRRLHRLGPTEEVQREVTSVRTCLHRLARAGGSTRATEGAVATLAAAGARLGSVLLEPLGIAEGDGGPVVAVPTGLLHGLPWAALPQVEGRSFVVAPSARSWLRSAQRPHAIRAKPLVLVAGPDLVGADAEVEALARTRPAATVLRGASATVGRTLDAMSGATRVHVAAHGDFRVDNPQLSRLRLDDGDLTVYELERRDPLPELVVLSACDAAMVGVGAGDELLGFSSALLRLGCRSVVAPLVPVADEAAVPLLVALHEALDTGSAPAPALASARARIDRSDPRQRAAAASFVAIGS